MSDINDLISKEALDSVNKLEATFAKIVGTLDELIKKSKSLDEVLSSMNKGAGSQEQTNKATAQAIKLNKEQRQTSDEIVKAKIRLAKATKDQRDALKSENTLMDENSGYIEKLRARIAQLNKEKEKLKKTDSDFEKQLKNINSELDKNHKALTATGSAYQKQKIGIGQYKEGILSAAGSLVGFTGAAGLAAVALDKLKEAFFSTEQGARTITRWTEGAKTFFNQLIHGNVQTAGVMAVAASEAAQKLDDIRKGDRKDLIEIARMETEIAELRYKAADATLSEKQQADALALAIKKEDDLIKYKIAVKQEELDAVGVLLAFRQDDTDLLNQQAQLEADILAIRGDKNLRLMSRESSLREKEKKDTEERKAQEEKDAKEYLDNINSGQVSRIGIVKNAEIEIDKTQQDALIRNNDYYDKQTEKAREAAKEQAQIEKEKLKLKSELMDESIALADELFARTFDRQLSQLDREKEAELKNAKDNTEEKEKINEKYEKKKIDIQRKAAKAEKLTALFSIAVDTAKGVVNAMSKVATIPLVPFILATGAIQAAIVASRPLPAYFKGTNYASGGPSIVGERGSELMIDPSGKMSLSGESAELVNLQRGTKIIPSDETKRIMAAAGMSKQSTIEQTIERGNNKIVQAIKNKKEIHLGTRTGSSIIEREGNQYKQYFNRKLN